MADGVKWCMVAKTVLTHLNVPVPWPVNAWSKPTVEIVGNGFVRFTWWELVKCDD